MNTTRLPLPGDSRSRILYSPHNFKDVPMTPAGPSAEVPSTQAPLNPHQDARALIRNVQCSQCSYPLRTSVTLTCGHSLCRQCLPPAHARENISYPANPSRQSGVTCPFSECQVAHPLDDCSVNVVLLKVMEALATEIEKIRSNVTAGQVSLEEVLQFTDQPPSTSSEELFTESADLEKANSRTFKGGRLVATYTFAEMGELHYTSDVNYRADGGAIEEDATVDEEAFGLLKDACLEKLECHVCYNLLLDPVTTPCGHTFCRKCLARILDHNNLCPHCRRELYWAPALNHQASDKVLTQLLKSVYPLESAARKEQAEIDERSTPNGMNTALFVCAVTFPSMPMILHVFEPRYRLMIRRALEGNRQFGMVAYNEHHSHQGPLGRSQFLDTGTMLQIEQYDLLEDGRMFLLCRGVYRFKVLAQGTRDGYIVGRVQRHDDVSFAEEERIEAEETSVPRTNEQTDRPLDLDSLPTSELMEQSHSFLRRAQAQSARWLQSSVLQVYGPPPTDPALFPYWFASVVPLGDEEKYKLLPTNSVRERLKITLKWIRKIESARCLELDSDDDLVFQ